MKAHTNIIVEAGQSFDKVLKAGDDTEKLIEVIRSTAQEWLDALGLPTEVVVTMKHVDQPSGPQFVDFAVMLNGVRCAFSRRQLVQVYESLGLDLHDHSSVVCASKDLLARAGGDKDGSQGMVFSFLAELVLEALKSSAEHLITLDITEALLNQVTEWSPSASADIKWLDRSFVMEVLRRLITVHVGAKRFEESVLFVAQRAVEGYSPAEVAERLIDEIRPKSVAIHVGLGLASELLNDDSEEGRSYPASELTPELGNRLGTMYDNLFSELGVWLPSITLVADPKLNDTQCRFRLHERLTPTLRVLKEDELLVNEVPAQLKQMGIHDARPVANPVNGKPCSIISRSQQDQVAAGLTMWDRFGYFELLLSNELRSAASTLLALSDVEYLLGELYSTLPELVAATLHRYSPLQVAQVLRWLLRDGVSIRNLRGVLGLMLDFSYTTGIRSPGAGWRGRKRNVNVGDTDFTGELYFTRDDPYVAQFDISGMQVFAEPAPDWIDSGRIHAEFVKCGLREQITYKVAPVRDAAIKCYLMDASIEMRLQSSIGTAKADNSPFSQEELTQILKGMAQEFAPRLDASILFLATTPDVALLVQDMIGKDFPEVRVLHRQLIEESANVQQIATVPRVVLD